MANPVRNAHRAGAAGRPLSGTHGSTGRSRARPPGGGCRVGGGGRPQLWNTDYGKERVRQSARVGIGGGNAARYWPVVRQWTGWSAGVAFNGRALAEPARLRPRGTGVCGEGTEFIERGHAPLTAPGDRRGEGRNAKVGHRRPFGWPNGAEQVRGRKCRRHGARCDRRGAGQGRGGAACRLRDVQNEEPRGPVRTEPGPRGPGRACRSRLRKHRRSRRARH